jgi:hypothetical protein
MINRSDAEQAQRLSRIPMTGPWNLQIAVLAPSLQREMVPEWRR